MKNRAIFVNVILPRGFLEDSKIVRISQKKKSLHVIILFYLTNFPLAYMAKIEAKATKCDSSKHIQNFIHIKKFIIF